MSAADTIFALSSGAAPAAIAIIRISGSSAFDAVHALAGRLPVPRRASLAALTDPRDKVFLDNALILTFPGPKSASGEDLAELHLHGGRAVVRAVENALSSLPGLRRAEPGEFTRRAFLHGRLDLNEAEGLADLLSAETEWQRRAAGAMMGGAFSAAIEIWRNDVLRLSAITEAELDFSDEDDVVSIDNSYISDGCRKLHDAIVQLLAAPAAEKLHDGIRVVLGGPPNSGKSTLLNALVSRDAAIVSDIAGTTRDMIEVPMSLEGIPFLFTDTAGLRNATEDVIEAMGIERSHSAINNADLLLWLGDEGAGPHHPQCLEIEAKIDDPNHVRKGSAAFQISALSGEGLKTLLNEIIGRAKHLLPPPDQFAVNQRQRRLLDDCASALAEASKSSDLLIVAENLRLARFALDSLTGRAHTEDMLDMLFGKFCIGK